MAHAPTLIRSIAALSILVVVLGSGAGSPGQQARTVQQTKTVQQARTVEQQTLIDFGLSRFDAQGLELPNVEIVFHDSVLSCRGRKGLYWAASQKLEMCSLDKATMLHELAHAWANSNLTVEQMDTFVAWRDLDSWNDQDDAWERRGTEHVAETIAWALLDVPNQVKWVEAQPDGSQTTTYRILSLDVDVEVLLENLKTITGQDPVFRLAGEWSINDETPDDSLELAKLGL